MFSLRTILICLASLVVLESPPTRAEEGAQDKPPPCAARYQEIRASEMASIVRGVDLQIRAQRERLTQEGLTVAEAEVLEELDRILNDEYRLVEAADLEILDATLKLFEEERRWNHFGGKDCKRDRRRFTLSCALVLSSASKKNQYAHFQPAIQEVRLAIDQSRRGENLEHPVHQFNNDPKTSIDDIRKVLRIARNRVASRLALQSRCAW